MSDPGIKLFGRTIQAPEAEAENRCGFRGDRNTGSPSSSKDGGGFSSTNPQALESEKEQSVVDRYNARNEDLSAVCAENDAQACRTEDHADAGISQEKALKKPEIILLCPRCNSMDTKFCYFNNYNTNQPRHFCKNCQRYWTAGGTMRNVPVGAGRRKNKTAAVAQFRHVAAPEAPQNHPSELHQLVLNQNGDAPVCESMSSHLNIGEQGNCVSSESKESIASPRGVAGNFQPFPAQIPCFPGALWPCQWPSPPGFSYASFPVPCYSPGPGLWTVPWIIPQSPSSSPSSPTLGKHSRDEKILKPAVEKSSERVLWVPKTSRIDDPGDATKSSLWATLGIKKDGADSVGRGSSLFKAFKSQSDGRGDLEASPVLQANPAALSRSLNFHEST